MKYLVDTNILLSYPEFVLQPGIEIILTYKVIAELDSKKYEPGTLGLASRRVSNWLDAAREKGNLIEGVVTDSDNVVEIIDDQDFDMSTDDALVEVTSQLVLAGHEVTLLSNDINVRIKGHIRQVPVSSWGKQRVDKTEYQCLPEILISDAEISRLYAVGLEPDPKWELVKNSYYMFKSEVNEKSTAICFYDGDSLQKVTGKKKVFGLSHRNVDQMCAIDALSKAEIPLITLVGKAGSGKTLMALSAGLEALLEKKQEGKLKVEKLLIIKPPIAMGADIGYLPGDADSKLKPWAGAFYDNLEVILGGQKNVEHYFANGQIEIVPPTFMRGRSLNNTFVILDEAQSLTRHEIKTIATRIGENSKLVITGDLHQIDNPRVSSADNGLAILIEAFKGTEWAICLDLVKGERSDFSSAAADLL